MKRPLWFIAAAAVALCAGTALSAAELNPDHHAKLIGSVDTYAPRISEVALEIWASPELGYQETKTTALLQDELRNAGFAIEAGVAGMPTAFVARAGTSGGPVIAILAEMDALPGMSQAADPDRKPIPNQVAGHACGHHLFDGAAAEQMMAASVPGDLIGYGLAVRIGGLRHAGQRVHLGEDRDDWTAARASARHERGRNSGDPRLDREPRVAQFVLKQRRGLGLLVSEFRRGPDLERDFRNARRIGVNAADQLRPMVGVELSRRKRRAGV